MHIPSTGFAQPLRFNRNKWLRKKAVEMIERGPPIRATTGKRIGWRVIPAVDLGGGSRGRDRARSRLGFHGIIFPGDTNVMRLLPLFALALTLPLHADFSYKSTRKTGGAMASMMGNQGPAVSTYYYKGDKLKIDNGATATVIDFGAQTITTINNTAKTVTVKGFGEMEAKRNAGDIEAKIDVRETGQKKNVNGFDASEAIMTMEVESPQTRQMGKMQMEMDMWLSSDVPGADQLRAFYVKNAANFPWASMSGGGNASMATAIADAQRKIASMHGMPVQQIIRVKAPGGAGAPAAPTMTPAQTAQMAKARAQLEAMAAQGGPAAAAAQQAMARMGGMGGGAAPSSSGAMIEITMDASDFSSAGIPDSVFAIPVDYQKTN
jgi:hypothetical protein